MEQRERGGDPRSEGPGQAEHGPSGCRGAGSGARRRHHRQRARKERVLHTRISEQLAEDIRRMADDLRVPVSNLVRNVLEEAFDVVETVTDNVGDFLGEVVEEAEQARERVLRRRGRRRAGSFRDDRQPPAAEGPLDFPDVVGWQPLIFNRARRCSDCGDAIEVGDRAFAGLGSGGLTPHALCSPCMAERR